LSSFENWPEVFGGFVDASCCGVILDGLQNVRTQSIIGFRSYKSSLHTNGRRRLFRTTPLSPETSSMILVLVDVTNGIVLAAVFFLIDRSSVQFIKHNAWRLFGKLSYCMFLIHQILVVSRIVGNHEPISLSAAYIVRVFISFDDFFYFLWFAVSIFLRRSGAIDCVGSRSSFDDRSSIHES
jgi:hypothetical protein